MQYLLLFHYNNGCMHAPKCYVYIYTAYLIEYTDV